MAVTHNGSVPSSVTGATSLAVSLAGFAIGEQALVEIAASSATSITMADAGYWTQLESDLDGFGQAQFAVFTRKIDGTEGSTRNFNFGAASNAAANAIRLGGQDPTTPINVSSTTGSGTSGNTVAITCPSVTTTVPGCMIVRLGQTVQATAMSTPGSHTTAGSATTGGGGSADPWVQAAYQTQGSAGATGSAAFASTGGDRPWIGYTIAIAPAAAAPPPPPPSYALSSDLYF